MNPDVVFTEQAARVATIPAGLGVEQIRDLVDAGAAYGMEAIIDLGDCDRGLLADRDVLTRFAGALVDAIGMTAYGQPSLGHFGHADPKTSGWTLVQLIETSSITMHCAEETGEAYLNVFSCRGFNAGQAAGLAGEWFTAGQVAVTVVLRQARRTR